MLKKKIFERFASVELLNFLFAKIEFLFKPQRYIVSILNDSMKQSRMVGVLGREGMGKSSAISMFIQNTQNVYYLRAGKSYAVKNMFHEMLYQVTNHYPNTSDSLYIHMKMLSSALTEDNKKKLFVIDDAGQLSPRALSIFFELRDNTRYTTGFVFVGLDYFQKKLLHSMKMGVPGIAEFYRRIENWFSIPSIPANEKSEYAKKKGLSDEQLLDVMAEKPETISQLENLIHALKEEEIENVSDKKQEKKSNFKGKHLVASSKSERVITEDTIDHDDDDDIEEFQKRNKMESMKKAREAKKKRQLAKKNQLLENIF